MAQDFTVLRCSQCKMYQVLPAKKSNKWQCKVCGLKQSVIKVYGSGSSKDCRRYVQASNSRGGHLLEALTTNEIIENAHPPKEIAQEWSPSCEKPICSKWTVFVEEINSTPSTEDDKKCTTNADEFSRFKKKSAINLSKRKLEQDDLRECSDAKRRNVQVICTPKSFKNEDNLQSQFPWFTPDLRMAPSCTTTNAGVAKSQPSLCMEINKPFATSKWSKYT